MVHRLRASIAIALLAAAPALSAGRQTPSMPGYPAPGAPAAVTVLSPGSTPRTPLRYQPRAGLQEIMDMTMVMGTTIEVGETSTDVNLPPVTISARLQVTEVAPNGDVTYALGFTKLSVAEGTSSEIAGAIQRGAAGITTVKASGVVSRLGVNTSVKLDTSGITDASMKDTLTQLNQSIQNLSLPLPEEPLGVGARWEARNAVETGGMTLFQKTEYELVSIDGLALSIRVKVDQTAPPQPVNNPDLPAGTTARLTNMLSSGTGTVALKLDSLVPTSFVESHSSITMRLNESGETQLVTTGMKLTMKVAPGK